MKILTGIPDHLKHGRFQKGIESAPDWNISRNSYWATPLPFWKCSNKSCGRAVCIGSLEELQQKATNYDQVYKSKDIKEVDLHRPYIDQIKMECGVCANEMQRVPEVVDCWVESGSMPFAEYHYPFENKELVAPRIPAQFVAEYINQTRTWFYVMHVISTILWDKPF
jgi:isoleucyl-tRNA synthetase